MAAIAVISSGRGLRIEVCHGTVQINSNMTPACMSLAEARLIFKFARDLFASARKCLG